MSDRGQGQVVIDGGVLLQIVHWELRTKFITIFQLFANCIKNKLSTADRIATVIFDSYPNTQTTKDATHARRYPSASLFVYIKQDTVLDISKLVI